MLRAVDFAVQWLTEHSVMGVIMAYDAGSIEAALTLDRTAFSEGVRQAQAEAKELEGKTFSIRVDADTRRARDDLLFVSALAQDMERRGVEINVKADTRLARADLTALDAQVEKIGVTSDRSTGRLSKGVQKNRKDVGLLVTAIAGLGPALVPLAAAGAGFGVAGVAGLGSLALAVKAASDEMKKGTAVGQAYSGGLKVLKTDFAGIEHITAATSVSSFNRVVAELHGYVPQATEDLRTFIPLIGDSLAKGIHGSLAGFTSFKPLITDILIDFDHLSTRFDNFASGGGFNSFVAYVRANLPGIEHDLSQVSLLILNILKAGSGSGLSILHVIGGIAEGLNTVNRYIPLFSTLVPLISTTVLTMKLFGLASKVLESSSLSFLKLGASATAASAAEVSGAARAAAATTAADSEIVAANERVIASNLAKGRSAAAGAGLQVGGAAAGSAGASAATAGASAAKGAVGVAIFGVAVYQAGKALSSYIERNNSFAHILDQTGGNIRTFRTALVQAHGALDDNVKSTVAAAAANAGLADKAAKAGISAEDLTKGITGGAKATQELIDRWKASGKPSDDTIGALTLLAASYQGVSHSAVVTAAATQAAAAAQLAAAPSTTATAASLADIAIRYGLSTDTATQYAKMAGISADANGNLNASNLVLEQTLSDLSRAYGTASDAQQGLLDAIQAFSGSAGTAADRAALIGATLKASNGDALGYAGTMAAVAVANQALVTGFDKVQAGTIKYGKDLKGVTTATIDYKNAASGPLISSLQSLQDAAEKAASATYQHELATKGAKVAADDAVAVYKNDTYGALISEAKQLGLTSDQAKALAKSYFTVPKDVKTKIEQEGADPVQKLLQGILGDLDKLTGTVHTIQIDTIENVYQGRGDAALGQPPPKPPKLPHKAGGAAAGMVAYAAGGVGAVFPGYAPGVDSISLDHGRQKVSPGEAVLVPEAVRGLGGPAAIYGLNKKFAPRVAGHYANYGLANGGVGQKFESGGFVGVTNSPNAGGGTKTSSPGSGIAGALTPTQAAALVKASTLARRALVADLAAISATVAKATYAVSNYKNLMTDLPKAFKAGLVSSAFVTQLQNENRAISIAVSRRSVLLARLAAAQKQVSDLTHSYFQEQATVKQAAVGGFDIGTAGNGSKVGFNADLDQQITGASKFDENLKKLKSLGLNSALLKQLGEEGYQTAGKNASLLASDTAAQIKAINDKYAKLGTIGQSTGTTVAESMYRAGISAAQGLVKGLESQSGALAKALSGMIAQIVTQLKTALKIKSPSQLLADEVGMMLPLGIAQGVDAGTHHAVDSMNRLASKVGAVTVDGPQLNVRTATTGSAGASLAAVIAELQAIRTELEAHPDEIAAGVGATVGARLDAATRMADDLARQARRAGK